MTNYGEVIRFLRKNKKLTQEELAAFLGCSREFISQVERNICSIPSYFILPLSKYLNYNIKKLIEESNEYKNFEHYILYCEFIDLIEKKDNYEISILLKNKVVTNEFSYGNAKSIKLYCKSLVETYINKDIDASIQICLKFLELKNIDEVANFKPQFNNIDSYYSIILIMAVNLFEKGYYSISKKLLHNTIIFLEENIFNSLFPSTSISFFFKKFYITTLNNYADTCFKVGDHSEALKYCNKTINLIHQHNILFVLDLLLQLKVEILYCMDDIEEAKISLLDLECICRISNNKAYYDTTLKKFNNKYPKLLYVSTSKLCSVQ